MYLFDFVIGAADIGAGETPDDTGDCGGGGSGGRLLYARNAISGITLVLSLFLIVVLRKVGILRPTRLSRPVFPTAEKGASQVMMCVFTLTLQKKRQTTRGVISYHTYR